MRDLGTLGGSWSEAYGVSADGNVVVGDAATPGTGGVGHAFRWTPGGGIQDMGTLGGEWSGARQVCADGSIVVGWAYTPDGEYHACRWDTAGTPLDLDTLGGRGQCCTGVLAGRLGSCRLVV
jgi:probable HAF family extracellular repeat protein